ncbi:hypothetical protein PVAP13_8KG372902 [Panicum virgatum]|uniref:Uncharacterized protein n=1 Tax=Panicum virgatum TaxID=38727 RepID=A0A8T0PSI9_PANVG|nr:hypothetical protein PVAP13_8KG372902 [Panicum virgatum]
MSIGRPAPRRRRRRRRSARAAKVMRRRRGRSQSEDEEVELAVLTRERPLGGHGADESTEERSAPATYSTDFDWRNKPSSDKHTEVAVCFIHCTLYAITSSTCYKAFSNPSSSQACSPGDVTHGENS